MLSEEELLKKEEERINRTLTNIGSKGRARPVSWNVVILSSLIIIIIMMMMMITIDYG